ncbi:MAG: HAMP domain-containing protein [Cyanomargarita calcarea GSE-NOS-MK-12-04C]|jgi:signal transduction histidine kinase|uniref:histidine kinase n=1 Tax=Cyanomargarita calcarea GSE-NOS-MK-12-04C TaxID=2839659 RepID=A0A951QSL8_9CYAN|nr:HAMP domain-containing protein [Cyanomargarita calcarea GSE-NOS-MK-12-04C]
MLFKLAIPKIPLRTILIVPFILQIFGAVGLTGYLSLRNGQEAVNNLANRLTSEISSRIDQHLDSYLTTPNQINQLNANAIKLRMLNLKNFPQLGQHFWQQMQVFNVGYISFTSTKGEYAGAGYFLDPEVVIIDEVSQETRYRDYTYGTDKQGNRTTLNFVNDYQPLKDIAYTGTVKAGKPIWGKITTWVGFPDIVSIAANYPVYNDKNILQGIVSADLRLSQISDFLRKLKVSRGGKVLIVERDGALVASSSKEQPFKLIEGKAQRINSLYSNVPLIQKTVAYLQQKFGKLSNIKDDQNLDFTIKGNRQFVHVTPWRDKFGLDWLVIVIVPESDFMEQINANRRTTILLCLGALLLATVLGIYTSNRITKPIQLLTDASEAISSGKLNQKLYGSRIHEIDILANSFNRMAQQLCEYFTALENNNEQLEVKVQERTNELKITLDDLQQAQAKLVQSEKMSSLGQMVGGIAHEINNPVSFIHGNLTHATQYVREIVLFLNLYQKHYPHPVDEIQQQLENSELDFMIQDLSKIFDSMQTGTQRIRDIVLSLRNFSHLDEADFKTVNIHTGLDSTLLLIQHRFRQIEVIKKYGSLPVVECYARQLNQVFLNILSNAIDILEESSVKIPAKIEIITELKEDNYAVIRIQDNGVGMSQEVLSKIFDPFFTTKPVGKGTGLGLSISYQIVVEQHGGTLDCISAPGKGCEFVITIPIRHGVARSPTFLRSRGSKQ